MNVYATKVRFLFFFFDHGFQKIRKAYLVRWESLQRWQGRIRGTSCKRKSDLVQIEFAFLDIAVGPWFFNLLASALKIASNFMTTQKHSQLAFWESWLPLSRVSRRSEWSIHPLISRNLLTFASIVRVHESTLSLSSFHLFSGLSDKEELQLSFDCNNNKRYTTCK